MRKRLRGGLLLVLLVGGLGLFFSGQMGCDKGQLNVFTVEQDKQFGQQLVNEINSRPGEYPLVRRDQMPEVYELLESIRDEILQSGELRYKDEFAWEVRLIDAPTLNAFCAPGGYIYFYTGILKFLDAKSQVAGVMGHEMAHADRRHSTKQLTKKYGISTLLDILVGDNASELTKIAMQMAQGLADLKFSRDDESEADRYAVTYLQQTRYMPSGVAGFFQKLQTQQKGASLPEFLSTHPSDENRIQAIKRECAGLDSTGKSHFAAEYQAFKAKYLK